MQTNILLIEDNVGDAELVMEAVKLIRSDIRIEIAADGQLGLDRLHRMAADKALPDLIICNCNLPRRTGAEVLDEVANDSELKSIPFIMLTSSSRDDDRMACSRARAYLTKGSTWKDVISIAKQIASFVPGRPEEMAHK